MKILSGGAPKQEGRSRTQFERQAPGTHALFGAGPAWLRPSSTAHGSHSSAMFDNCLDVGV
jgi:hypothetical protein